MSTDLPKTPSWKRTAPFRLGDLEVLPASGELRGRRGVERLRPLLMDILLRLAADPGEVVRRETLLEDVWPRRMVNDEVLSRAIAELRTALGDDARVARYIETLPKLGYRLVVPVQPIVPVVPVVGGVDETRPSPQPEVARVSRPAWTTAAGWAVLVIVAIALWWTLGRPRETAPGAANLGNRLVAARPLTSDPSLELGPRFSPDGQRVAFALTDGNESRIVVQTLDGSSRQFVGGLEGLTRLSPIFFPDGRRLAFWKGGKEDCAIVEHDLDSGLERKLVDCTLAPRSRFDVSRDGRWLVFSGNARKQFPAGLWVVEVGRGGPVALTSPEPGAGDDLYPRFGPDGKRIAFFRGSESHKRPWIVARDDGSSARAIGKIDGLAYGVAWLGPEGPLLAAGDWFGFRALNVIDVSSGEARLAGARGARFPDVGPRGEIVFENAVYAANLWPFDTRRGKSDGAVWRSTRYSNQPEFSPDGKLATFASNRDGTDAIYVAPLLGDARRIAFGEAHRYMRPHWSADGRWVYAVRTTANPGGDAVQEGIRIPAEGGAAEVLANLGRAVNDVRDGGDGNLYWGELSGNAMRLMRAPLAQLEKGERLPLPLMSQYQIHSGRVAFAQPQIPKLTSCRLDTLACEPIDLEIAEAELYHWTLTARALYLRQRDKGEARLARYDFAARRIDQSWPFAPTGAGTSIAVSPDETLLLVVREEALAIDLMLAR